VMFELLTAKDAEIANAPIIDSQEEHMESEVPLMTRGIRAGANRDCLQSCQRDCRSSRRFLTGNALGQCLRGCRRECGYA
jgi:hypothetical protein